MRPTMSEREPAPEEAPKQFYIDYNGEKFVLTGENTKIYVHRKAPEYDHFFVCLEHDDEEETGTYRWIYREESSQFSAITLNLVKDNATVITKNYPDQVDIDQYNKQRKGETAEPEELIPETPEYWISPRNEKLIQTTAAFIVYLAEHGEL